MTTITIARSRTPLVPHEALDAYWFAQMLLYRALRIAAYASCTTTVGRRLESALGRAVRLIAEAADGTADAANSRLRRAREAIAKALVDFDALLLGHGVDEAIVADLRTRAMLLLDRLQTLEGQSVKTWSASNCLPTVLDEARTEVDGNATVNVVTALAKVPDAAVRDLLDPVVPDEFILHPPPRRDRTPSTSSGEEAREPGENPTP